MFLLAMCLSSVGALAQPVGPGGINFWNTPVTGDWFNFFAWNGTATSQGGVPNQDTTAHMAWGQPYTVSILGQGQLAQCHHLSIAQPGVLLRIVGASATASLTVHGSQIINEGMLRIGGADAMHDSRLVLASHTTATGPGRIRLEAPMSRVASINANSLSPWLLVNASGHSIEGNGQISVRLQNDGLIHANVLGRELRFDAAFDVINNGTIRASSGGDLTLALANANIGFAQSGNGEIVVESASVLRLISAGQQGFSGGELHTQGNGQILVATQGFPIQNVTLSSGSRLGFIGNNGLRILPGGLTNDGLIQTGTNGFITSLQGGSATVTGSGRIQLEGGLLGSLLGGVGQALVNGAQHSIGGIGSVNVALTNNGSVLADRNGLGTGPSELLLQQSPQLNNGLIAASGSGTLRLLNIPLTQSVDAVLHAGSGSAVLLDGATINGGTLSTSGSGLIYVNGATPMLQNLRIGSGSQVLTPCSRALNLVGNIDNRGTLSVDNSACGPVSATLRGVGSTQLTGAGGVRLLALSASSTNALLEASGGTLVLSPAQVVSGYGRLAGTISLHGALAPDQPFAPAGPIGTIALNSGADLRLESSADLYIDLASATSFDRLAGSGTIRLGGTLMLSLVGAYVPPLGASFDIVMGSSITSGFAEVILPAALATLDARIEILPDRARLHLVAPLFKDGFEVR